MIRKFQKIIDPIDGDCLRACISTITEIPVAKLPANDRDSSPGGYYEDLSGITVLWTHNACTSRHMFETTGNKEALIRLVENLLVDEVADTL